MRSQFKLSIVSIAVLLSSPAFALADFSYFVWTPTGGDSYSASLNGIGATLAYSSMAADSAGPTVQLPTAVDFNTMYGESIDVFGMSNGAAGSSAEGNAEIVFDVALPDNAILIAFDLDTIRMDEFQFSNSQSPLAFLEQLETNAGANSSFPIWDSATQSLISSGIQGNADEATVFNLGGNTTLDVSFLRDAGGASVGAASFAIGIPVPEPNGLAILMLSTLFATHRNKRTTAKRS